MSDFHHPRPVAAGRDSLRVATSPPPFSPLALSARDRLAATAVALIGLWLTVAWALDWTI